MKIAVACGGTGGHIFPGLATAVALQARGHAVTLWLAGKAGESIALAGWNGAVLTVPVSGFSARSRAGLVGKLFGLLCAVRRCFAIMRGDKPQVLLAMGSFASVGPVLAAWCLRVPVVLHEANVVPGRAILFLARRADAVALGFVETRAYIRHKNTVFTGMPVRAEQLDACAGQADELVAEQLSEFERQKGFFTFLIMGGSRGAHRLNELASESIACLAGSGRRVRVIHLAGVNDEASVRACYVKSGVPNLVCAFLRAMPRAYRLAGLALCRSGASTCAELARYGLPAVLVPYPFAADQHQMANARVLAQAGAAEVRAEADLTVDAFVKCLAGLLEQPERLEQMRRAAYARAIEDAAERLARLVEQTAESNSKLKF